ncbi:serine protease [Streptomyces litchfieldiae]|uniref:Serine protease n=1 Tax=Streptomyces litchfieldiae TaxID=3075543 RepID=A0ABU2MT68_9ACTN|nr:serine protease [Streptomyces sp. DSM 44938]MDT0344831.1 serine protease [Streptomyces sp. DSM 44938]
MTAPEPAPLAGGILRVLRPDGVAAGAAFLVTERLALTCAHVIGTGSGVGPGLRVMVDVGVAGGPGPFPATVREWHPEADVAVLEVAAPLPGTRPVPLVETGDLLWGHRARTLGFPRGHDQGVWHAAVLRQQQGNGWLQFEQAGDGRYAVSRGFSGAPVWDDELAAVVGMVVAADLGHPVAFLIPTDRLVAAVPSLREVVGLPSPFPGLGAYQESDAETFFGRKQETERITRLVLDHPLVTVLGASGCGKSSVVRAGVVPRLHEEGLATCVVPRTRDLLGALATGLTTLTRPELRGHAQRDEIRWTRRELAEGRLPDLVDQIRTTHGVDGLVIVVDQLEELLTRGDSDAPLALLFGDSPPDGLRILTTLRVDFLQPVEENPMLRRAVRGATFLLPQMTPDQIREAVTGPVERVPAVSYQDGLVDRIVEHVGNAAGVLPLLGFTLDQLWRDQRAGLLTLQTYAELGGVHGALAKRAERAWERHTSDGTNAEATERVRRLLTRLIRLPPGTHTPIRRTARRAELSPGEWEAARFLADQRLLVIAPPETEEDARYGESVELAHEALIRVWPTLRDLAEADRDFLAWHERLRQDQARWAAAGSPDDLLPGETALAAAEPWVAQRSDDIGAADLDFLERGRARHRRQARLRRGLFGTLGTVALVIAVLASLFGYQTRVSATRDAESESRALAAASADALATDPALAAMYALAAYERAPTDEARDALLQTYVTYGSTELVMSGARGGVDRVAASGDGRVILTTGREGQATLFLRDEADQLSRERLPFGDDYALYPFVSHDGKRAGYVTPSGALVWYGLGEPGAEGGDGPLGRSRTIPGPDFSMDELGLTPERRMVAVSQDGDRVVAASLENQLFHWDLDTETAGEAVLLPPLTVIRNVWFGRDRDFALVEVAPDPLLELEDDTGEFANHEVLRVNLMSGEVTTIVEDIVGAAFSGDGTTLAFCDADDTLSVARADESVHTSIAGACDSLSTLALDHTGRYVSNGSQPPVVHELSGDGEAVELAQAPGNVLTAGSDDTTHGSILTDGDRYFHLVADSEAVVLVEQPLTREPIHSSLGLLGEGDRVIAYTDDHDGDGVTDDGGRSHLGLYDITGDSGTWRQLAEVERQGATFVPAVFDVVTTNRRGDLLADLMTAEGRIVIRDTETLRPVTEIQTEPLPPNPHPNPMPEIQYFFRGDRHLITRSGSVVERWDARTGQRTDRVDLADLGLLSDDPLHAEWLQITGHPRDDHIAVVNGGPEVRVVDMRAGREVAELRADTGERLSTVSYNAYDERHMIVVRPATAWEQWQLPSPRRLTGPTELCGGCPDDYVISPSIRPDGRFQLASAGQVRIYDHDSAVPVGRWDVGRGGDFLTASDDGDTLLYVPWNDALAAWSDAGQVTVIRLDGVEEWRNETCRITGWLTVTDGEEVQETTGLPARGLCDPPG